MNKQKSLTVLLALMFCSLTFANGARENETEDRDFGPDHGRPMMTNNSGNNKEGPKAFFNEEDSIALTGILDINNDFPRLIVNEKVYILVAPAALPDGIELKDGQQITIEGYLIDTENGIGFLLCDISDEEFVSVVKVVIDGKEYELMRTRMATRTPAMKDEPQGGGPQRGGPPPQHR